MTNYTYEQRKMIAEYLENEILTISQEIEQIYKNNIRNKIKNLKLTTFEDIKNIIGTKFICTPLFDRNILVIVYDPFTMKNYIFCEQSHQIMDVSLVTTDWRVEVINE